MSESIFETSTDERGNISVRISQEVQVLTREEANRIEAEYRRMQADNAKLRELVSGLYKCWLNEGCEGCPMQDDGGWCVRDIRLRELGVEVD